MADHRPESTDDVLRLLVLQTAGLGELRERIASLEAKTDAQQTALLTAKRELDRRLEEMNEFRAQINSERGIFLTKDAYEREHKLMQSSISELRESRAGALGSLGALAGVIAFVLSVATIIVTYWRH